MSNGPLKLAIAVMAYGGQISSRHARMWLEVGNTLGASSERFRLVMFETIDVNPVDRARREAVETAINHKADWLLMIDADTWVEADADSDAGFSILRMISEADRNGAHVVAAPVVQRSTESQQANELMVYRLQADPMVLDKLHSYELKPMMEIGAAATAVMALKIPFVAENKLRFKFTEALSEDLDFCRQVRTIDGKIVVDSRVVTGHLGRQFPLYYPAHRGS